MTKSVLLRNIDRETIMITPSNDYGDINGDTEATVLLKEELQASAKGSLSLILQDTQCSQGLQRITRFFGLSSHFFSDIITYYNKGEVQLIHDIGGLRLNSDLGRLHSAQALAANPHPEAKNALHHWAMREPSSEIRIKIADLILDSGNGDGLSTLKSIALQDPIPEVRSHILERVRLMIQEGKLNPNQWQAITPLSDYQAPLSHAELIEMNKPLFRLR